MINSEIVFIRSRWRAKIIHSCNANMVNIISVLKQVIIVIKPLKAIKVQLVDCEIKGLEEICRIILINGRINLNDSTLTYHYGDCDKKNPYFCCC